MIRSDIPQSDQPFKYKGSRQSVLGNKLYIWSQPGNQFTVWENKGIVYVHESDILSTVTYDFTDDPLKFNSNTALKYLVRYFGLDQTHRREQMAALDNSLLALKYQ